MWWIVTHKMWWWKRKGRVSFSCKPLYSLALLFVRILIHPYLTLVPSSFVPTWHTLPLLDLFHLMSWRTWPIRLRHLSVAARGFACSITLLIFMVLSELIFSLLDISHFSSCEILDIFPLSHEATPFSSNLIDMKESAVSWAFILS